MAEHGVIEAERRSAEVVEERVQKDEELDLLGVAILLLQGKKTILYFWIVSMAITAGIVFFLLRPTYTAEALFLPPHTSPGNNLTQLGGQVSSLGTVGMLGGFKNSGDVYVGI